MVNWRRAIRGGLLALGERLAPARAPAPGLYAFSISETGRLLHLRLRRTGGELLIDAADVVHLNGPAAETAYWALAGAPPAAAARRLRAGWGAGRRRADRDVRRVYALVDALKRPSGSCPTCALPVARRPLFSQPPAAPYKADLALTYGCNNACAHCYNETRGPEPLRRILGPPLHVDQWRRVLETLCRAGVPHVVFTGGEPLLAPGVVELVETARRLGLIAGLNTNGRRLAGGSLAERLARAGLSHIQITLLSHRPEVHNRMCGAAALAETTAGIRAAVRAGLHVVTNTTLTRTNAEAIEQTVAFVHSLGVRVFAANGVIRAGGGRRAADALAPEELPGVLTRIRDQAEELGMRFLWYTPTRYCEFSPLEFDLGPRRCNAAEYSICIEPDGAVSPCQSYPTSAGYLLRDGWEAVWNSPLFLSFRRRGEEPEAAGLPSACAGCPDLPVCGGGCRLENEWRAAGAPKREAAR